MISRVAGLPQSRFARQLPPGGSDFVRRFPRWELRLPQALRAFAMTTLQQAALGFYTPWGKAESVLVGRTFVDKGK